MSGVCRQWTESFDASFDRGLTARPVVLAKTYEPGASRSRREWRSGPGVTMTVRCCQAMPAALERVRRRGAVAVSIRLRPADLAR
jgi:hypothetical protein